MEKEGMKMERMNHVRCSKNGNKFIYCNKLTLLENLQYYVFMLSYTSLSGNSRDNSWELHMRELAKNSCTTSSIN